jgi:type I restriction enzyme, S subunit
VRAGRYLRYPEYRESGQAWCGEIPYNWDFRRTKFLFQIKKRIAGELGHSVLSITQKGIKVKDTESGEGQLSMDYSKYQLVEVGDFAMNHMDLLTGYIDISEHDGVTSPDYRVFCSRDSSIVDRYFLYLYQLAYIKGVFFPLGQGSAHLGRWRLPAEEFNGFRWPVPSKKEQEQIANFLDHETAKIDTLIDMQQQLIKLLKEKRQAVISRAVTKGLNPAAPKKDSGIEWLGEVPEHWKVCTIKYAFKNLDFRRIPLSSEVRGERSGVYRYYGASGVIDHIDDYIFDESTVLIGEDGANLLARSTPLAFSAHGQYWVNNHAHILKPMDEFADYWAEVLENIDVTTLVSGSAQPKLTAEALGSLKIAFPPDSCTNERKEIDSFIKNHKLKFQRILEAANAQVALLKERRTSLISAAVTGKIDVRNWQPAQTNIPMEASA